MPEDPNENNPPQPPPEPPPTKLPNDTDPPEGQGLSARDEMEHLRAILAA